MAWGELFGDGSPGHQSTYGHVCPYINNNTNKGTEQMPIIRGEKNGQNPFVMIDRRQIQREDLSMRARGLYAYLLSMPDNWRISVNALASRFSEGRHVIQKTMKELREKGYLTTRSIHCKNGQFGGTETVLNEIPELAKIESETPQAENPTCQETDIRETRHVGESTTKYTTVQKKDCTDDMGVSTGCSTESPPAQIPPTPTLQNPHDKQTMQAVEAINRELARTGIPTKKHREALKSHIERIGMDGIINAIKPPDTKREILNAREYWSYSLAVIARYDPAEEAQRQKIKNGLEWRPMTAREEEAHLEALKAKGVKSYNDLLFERVAKSA